MRKLPSNATLERDLNNIMVEARTILLKKRRGSIGIKNSSGFVFTFGAPVEFSHALAIDWIHSVPILP